VGLPYGVELVAAVGIALLAWRSSERRDGRAAIGASALLALAGGIRPSAVPLLLPLWLFGMSGHRRTTVAAGAGVLVGGCLFWAIPTVWLSGGIERYWTATARLARAAGGSSTVLTGGRDAVAWNGWFMAASLLLGLGPGLAAVAPRLRYWLAAAPRRRRQVAFFACWLSPSLAFFLLVHIGQPGYLLIVLPALCLLLADALLALGGHLGLRDRYRGRAGTIFAVLAIAANVLVFLLTSNALTAAALADERRFWREVENLRSAYPPETTAVITAGDQAGAFRQAAVQMPNYPVRAVGPDRDGSPAVRFARHGGAPQFGEYLAGAPAQAELLLAPDTNALLVLDRPAADVIGELVPLELVGGTSERPIYGYRGAEPLPPLRLDAARGPAP
jgi:hypothetical protein